MFMRKNCYCITKDTKTKGKYNKEKYNSYISLC